MPSNNRFSLRALDCPEVEVFALPGASLAEFRRNEADPPIHGLFQRFASQISGTTSIWKWLRRLVRKTQERTSLLPLASILCGKGLQPFQQLSSRTSFF